MAIIVQEINSAHHTTVEEIINGSARLAGIKGAGRSLNSEQTFAIMSVLKQMLKFWENENVLIHAITRSSFTLVTPKSAYSIGPGGDLDAARPENIINIVHSAESDTLLSNIDASAYAVLSATVQSGVPSKYWYNPTIPFGVISLDRTPNAGDVLHIDSLSALTEFYALSDRLGLPEGYERAIRYNLALEISAEYGKEPSALIIKNAIESLDILKRHNRRVPSMTIPSNAIPANTNLG